MASKRKTGPGVELRPESLESAKANLPPGASLADIAKAAERIQASNDAETAMTEKAAKKGAEPKPPRMQLGFSTRDIEPAEEEIELPTRLGETEVAHQGAINAQTQGEIDRLQGEMADDAEAFRKKRKEDKKALAELQEAHKAGSREVREKSRMMLQKVRIEHDFGLGASRYYRRDRGPEGVGELYDTKPMDPDLRAKLAKKHGAAAPVADPPVMDPPSEESAAPAPVIEPDKLN